MTDRTPLDHLTHDQYDQLCHRLDRAKAELARVRELHRKATHGDVCVYCAPGQRLGYDTTWPCDTIRALDGSGRADSTPAGSGPDDLTGVWVPDPPIGCLTPTAEAGTSSSPEQTAVEFKSPASLRTQLANAIRAATCRGNCGDSEDDCTRQRIQPALLLRGVLTEVSGTPEMFADAVLPVIQPHLARDSEATVQRVTALYERWVKAGPPPLGTLINRWWDRRLAELAAALNPTKEQPTPWAPPPPGSTAEQLPPAVLALLPEKPYLSTACDTAQQLEQAPRPTPTSSDAIPDVKAYTARLHARCRLNHKFTGALCVCGCHTPREQQP